jgi:outer membrane receptor protein involved in Fe transport
MVSAHAICVAQSTIPKRMYFASLENNTPISGVLIQDEKGRFISSSDENGIADLTSISVSSGKLLCSRIGYSQVRINTDSLAGINNPVIYLRPAITSMNEIVVNSGIRSNIFHTISSLDIHIRPINNSQEILRMVPGLFIGQHAGGGKAEQIFLRGFDIDHGTDIQITADGMPVNMVSHAHGQGYADLHFLIPELIESVAFDKGPYEASKGNFSTAGHIDFRTPDLLKKNFLKAELGQFDTYRLVGGVNLLKPTSGVRKEGLFLAGEASLTQGFFDSPQDFSRLNGMLKYYRQFNDRHSLSVSASGFSSRWNASGQIPERAVAKGQIGFYGAIDDTEGGQTSRYSTRLALKSTGEHGGVFENSIYFVRYAFELYSNFTFFKEDTVNGDQIRQKERRNILGYQGSYKKSHTIGQMKANFFGGVQLRYDDIHDVELTKTKNRVDDVSPLMKGDVKEYNGAAFAEEELNISKKLSVTAGLRMDHFANNYDNALDNSTRQLQSFIVSPKLSIQYEASRQWLIYLKNGRGFHSNDTRAATNEEVRTLLPPAWGTDLGTIFKPGKKWMLQLAAWYLKLDQEFVYVGDAGIVEPGGETERMGLDVSARFELFTYLYADMDLNFTKPRNLGVSKDEQYIPLAPLVTSTGGISYRKASGLNGSLRYRYMAKRPANVDYSIAASPYFIVDAAVNYTWKKWELGLSVQNMLNTKWKETQFETESRLKAEPAPVTEIHFTPGSPFFARLNFSFYF